MRVSVFEGDPGYFPAPGCDVFLDGHLLRYVYTADEERGLAVVADLDDRGRLRTDHMGRRVRTKVLRGEVRIKPHSDGALAKSLGDR